jgi:hypothetical protein
MATLAWSRPTSESRRQGHFLSQPHKALPK